MERGYWWRGWLVVPLCESDAAFAGGQERPSGGQERPMGGQERPLGGQGAQRDRQVDRRDRGGLRVLTAPLDGSAVLCRDS